MFVLQREKKKKSKRAGRNHTFTFTSALISFPLQPVIMIRRCPADCSCFQRRGSDQQSGCRAAHGEDLHPSVFYSLRDAGLIHTYVATQTRAGLLIHSHNFSGILRVFTVHYNTHTHTLGATPAPVFINRALLGSLLEKLGVLLSRHASWNSARASRSFAISHLYKPWDQPIWIIQSLH